MNIDIDRLRSEMICEFSVVGEFNEKLFNKILEAMEQLQAENKLLKEISKLDKEIISKLKELL